MARIYYFKSEILEFHFNQCLVMKYKQFFGIVCRTKDTIYWARRASDVLQ